MRISVLHVYKCTHCAGPMEWRSDEGFESPGTGITDVLATPWLVNLLVKTQKLEARPPSLKTNKQAPHFISLKCRLIIMALIP